VFSIFGKKIFKKRLLAYQHLDLVKIDSWLAVCEFTNLDGWIFWSHLFALHKAGNDYMIMLFPAWETKLYVFEWKTKPTNP